MNKISTDHKLVTPNNANSIYNHYKYIS